MYHSLKKDRAIATFELSRAKFSERSCKIVQCSTPERAQSFHFLELECGTNCYGAKKNSHYQQKVVYLLGLSLFVGEWEEAAEGMGRERKRKGGGRGELTERRWDAAVKYKYREVKRRLERKGGEEGGDVSWRKQWRP